MAHTVNTVTFHDGNSVPQLGFGVWQIGDDKAPDIVCEAVRTGYRLFDTAAMYGNEAGVGQGIRQCGVDRRELRIATKVWNDRHGYDQTMAAFDESLRRLGLDYVDLYLIHWPVPDTGLYVKTWEALIQLRDEGRAKSIGVCNFTISQLQHLLDETGVLPVLNQIELHPRFQQPGLRDYHAEKGIATQAWSPLGNGRLMGDPVLAGIARKHGRTIAQVVLRWHMQLGNMAIPKSATPSRIDENFAIGDFVLDDTDMRAVASLHRPDGRQGPDPEQFR